MAGLSDITIRRRIEAGEIVIDPYDPLMLQPASMDLRLDRYFRIFDAHTAAHIDPFAEQDITKLVQKNWSEPFFLHPGEFVLASTYERVEMPDDLRSNVEGKSSLGRLGLLIHSTAGFIDPGFQGHITLELSNVLKVPIKLLPGMLIAQMSFDELDRTVERPYGHGATGSKYGGQEGPTASRYFKNYPDGPPTQP